jgi:coproporphyrinogen III oxidase-like Fe-S oxidoreductase
MFRAAASVLFVASAALNIPAAEPVAVKGSATKYPTAVSATVGQKTYRLNLTGVGLRTKLGFGVYAIGSYLEDGARVRTAEELMKTDAVRALHLVMERDVQPREFVDAFKTAIGKNHPADKFQDEFAELMKAVGDRPLKKGDQIVLVAAPATGVRIQIVGKVDVSFKNAAFTEALWEVYLGARPLDEKLKKGLVEMLAR